MSINLPESCLKSHIFINNNNSSQTILTGLHLSSDALIASLNFFIAILLIDFCRKQKDEPFRWIALLFSGFMGLTGVNHLISIGTIWYSLPWFSGIIKGITAIVALVTVSVLFPRIPKILTLPSSAQLETANHTLQETLSQLQLTQSQMIQAEKMSSLGQMVAGVAHEINNPVNFVYGNIVHAKNYTQDLLELLKLYQQEYPHPTPIIQEEIEAIDLEFLSIDLLKLLNSMQVGADRIREIVRSLRTFSRLDEAEMKAVNIHEGLDSTLMILQHRLKAHSNRRAIQVIQDYSSLPKIDCYPGQLNQVFMNLLSNSIDALEDIPDQQRTESPTIRIHTEVMGDRARIQVIDNGQGIEEKVRQQLFDPFFTTKSVGQGTGLGLAISYQIVVDKHGGEIHCLSEVGQGTTFTIDIPIEQSMKDPRVDNSIELSPDQKELSLSAAV